MTPSRSLGRPSRAHLLLASIVVFYVASRAVGILHFAPHNDEVIYAFAAAMIADDWQANRWVFQDGRLLDDYKEPLPTWAEALTVNWFADPLIGMRLWSLVLGLLGLLCVHRLVARVWSEAAASVAAASIALSEYHLYFDSVAMNEAFLYGLGAGSLLLLFDALEHRRVASGLGAAALLAGVLSAKGSGVLWIGHAALIPLLVGGGRRRLAASFAITAACALAALLAHDALVPDAFDPVRDRDVHRSFVRSAAELAELPVSGWLDSLHFYARVLGLEFSYALLPAAALVAFACVRLARSDRAGSCRYAVLILLYLSTWTPLVLLAKVHFIRYFGPGLYFAHVLLAIALVVAWERLRERGVARGVRLGLAAAALVPLLGAKLAFTYAPLVRFGQTELSLAETPDAWANGSGIPELLARVSGLAPGVLVVDPQWGHPGTALRVFHARYPQLDVRMLSDEWTDAARVRRNLGPRPPRLYYAIDARTPGERPPIDRLLRNRILCAQRQSIEKRFRDRVLPGSLLVICEASL
jgi:hypothetical protein